VALEIQVVATCRHFYFHETGHFHNNNNNNNNAMCRVHLKLTSTKWIRPSTHLTGPCQRLPLYKAALHQSY